MGEYGAGRQLSLITEQALSLSSTPAVSRRANQQWRLLPRHHGGGFAFEVDERFAGDVDDHAADRPTSEGEGP